MNKTQKIILIGAGGHAKSVIDVIENTIQQYEIIGYTDLQKNKDIFWEAFNYLGKDNEHEFVKDANYHIGVGMIKNLQIREQLFLYYKSKSANFPIINSNYAIASKRAIIGEGCIVMHHVIVNTGARIGVNCILNNKCLIEHDTVVGNHCHISTGAIINADCIIGNNVFIGSNVTVNRGIKIGDNVIIGSGSVVTRDIPPNNYAMGVPAKIKLQ